MLAISLNAFVRHVLFPNILAWHKKSASRGYLFMLANPVLCKLAVQESKQQEARLPTFLGVNWENTVASVSLWI